MKNTDYTLIITGCINPSSNVYALALKDSNERRIQTIKSIEFFLTETKAQKIVYCENSGAEVEEKLMQLAKAKHKSFEWIGFNGDIAETEKRGKGYGEGEILNYAIKHSKIVSNNDYIIKVTGRIKVLNFNIIVSKMKNDRIYINLYERRKSAKTLFWGMPRITYEKFFIDCNQDVDDRNWHSLENAYGATIVNNNLKYAFIPSPLILDGIAGTSGNKYNQNILQRNKSYIRMHGEKFINSFVRR